MWSHYFIKDHYYKYIKGEIPVNRYCFYKQVNGKTIIFIHIPKTAGTSIARALGMPPPNPKEYFGINKHEAADVVLLKVGQKIWKDSIKLACVRNPWQRLYSFWVYRRKTNQMSRKKLELDFDAWARRVLTRPDLRDLKSQCTWLGGDKLIEEFDLIIRFESLNEDIQQLEKMIGLKVRLPHLLNTRSSSSYRRAYSPFVRELVASVYEDDILKFGYSF